MKKLSSFLRTTEGMFIGTIVVLVVFSFAYYFYVMSKGETTSNASVTVTEQDHVRGTLGAKVTLVEFGDFQCPACGAYEPVVRKVLADNAGSVTLVFKHFPLTQIHQNALLAAKASEAAALQGRFWEMHDMLYDNQTEWSGALNARDIILGYATKLGLDVAKFTQDLASEDIEKKIVAEYKEGVALGVQGTPTFFLNGKMISNPTSVEAFNNLIKASAAVSGQ
ncbi:MAG: hypothetical protein RIQ41_313 [Candidatus Parcubacteria bacterium]|jgi:protein-disulfide isomerase